jgi:hypothetical protein
MLRRFLPKKLAKQNGNFDQKCKFLKQRRIITLIFKNNDIFPPMKIAENNDHNIDPRSTAEERSKADEVDDSDNSDDSEDWFLGGFTDWLQQGIAMSNESTSILRN